MVPISVVIPANVCIEPSASDDLTGTECNVTTPPKISFSIFTGILTGIVGLAAPFFFDAVVVVCIDVVAIVTGDAAAAIFTGVDDTLTFANCLEAGDTAVVKMLRDFAISVTIFFALLMRCVCAACACAAADTAVIGRFFGLNNTVSFGVLETRKEVAAAVGEEVVAAGEVVWGRLRTCDVDVE